MATVNALVHRRHRKSDGSYNVKIRVFHHEKKYIETEHYITDRQLRPDGTIKDTFILSLLNRQLDDYRETISRPGDRIELYSAERLRDYLRDKDKPIDFAAFCKEVIDFRMANKQKGSARKFRSVRFSFIDYFGRESVSVMEIHSDMLREYEAYLRTERTITRPDQFGIPKTRKVKGMTDIGLHNHMRDLRALFNLAAKKYNNKSLGITRIPHNPFEDYIIVKPKKSARKKKKLDRGQLLAIISCPASPCSRMELSRDLFKLSFYMCGMNAKDIHDLRDEDIINGRVEYNRSKTTGRRDDDAFISIKIVDEVKPLLDKYLNVLRDRYSTFENLDHALAKGMEQICRKLGWEEKAEEEAVAKAARFKSKDKASTVLKSERISELENELEVLTKKVAELETELVHRDQIVGAKDETIEVLKKYVSSLEKDKVDLKIELETIREKFFTKTGARKSG